MRLWGIVMLLFFLSCPLPCQAESGGLRQQIVDPVAESISIRKKTQKEEEQWREDRQKMAAEYEQLQWQKEQLQERHRLLDEKVTGTRGRIAVKEKQLADIEQMQATIVPVIADLIADLGNFVAGDVPFLTGERRKRLQRLQELGDDPEVSVSEKFRKVMEALLIEAEYGNTIEVYQETITTEGRDILVDVFRLGRLGLFFQTLDRRMCGFYNVASSLWQPLPPSYNRSLETAVEIGAKRRPVELLTLPLGRIAL